jgi:hypothetical protein
MKHQLLKILELKVPQLVSYTVFQFIKSKKQLNSLKQVQPHYEAYCH